MTTASKIILKHFFRPEQKVVRVLPVYYPPQPPREPISEPEVTLPTTERRGEDKLDLNGYLISHPSSTFFVKISGEPLPHLGIYSGDLLVVDQTLEVHDGNLIVGVLQESFFASFIKIKNKQLYLAGESAADTDQLITPELKCSIWGVVSYTIHKPTMKPVVHSKKKLASSSSETTTS